MSWHKLHDIKPGAVGKAEERVFCGPGALMTITGKDHGQVCRALNRASHSKPSARVRSVATWHIVRTMERMGLKVCQHVLLDQPTLWSWVMNRRPDEKRGLFLVNVTGHYVVINGYMMNDNHTLKPVMIDDMPWKKKRVQNVWRIGKG